MVGEEDVEDREMLEDVLEAGLLSAGGEEEEL